MVTPKIIVRYYEQAVQDLIDQGKIEPLKGPNTVGNPFPNNQINTLEFEEMANMQKP